MIAVEAGDRLRIHYTGRRQDGTVFDTSRGGDPFAFTAGSAELIAGVSRAVVGMAIGERKTVTVSPEDGYGVFRPGLSRRVPRRAVPADAGVGDAIEVGMGEGVMMLWIKELHEDHAVLEPNHPLAGQTLEFDLEVVSIDSRRGA